MIANKGLRFLLSFLISTLSQFCCQKQPFLGQELEDEFGKLPLKNRKF